MNSRETIDYYNENAKSFIAGTKEADVSDIRKHFLGYLSTNDCILDWGCGSGRDANYFHEAGFKVDARDASLELVRVLKEDAKYDVKCESFQELNEIKKYDGIWACASLLHVKYKDLPYIFSLARKALKEGGVMYASFKYGDFEGDRGGRYFTDLTEDRFDTILENVQGFIVEKQWITSDVRPERSKEKWLNIIMRAMPYEFTNK